jgi:hypothetical protein
MYARLWWKEARTLWPIWLALVVFACGMDGAISYLSEGAALRNGGLAQLGVALAVLYAFAAGAAAFASERETKMLGFLDVLPVSRKVLWTAKTSFALISAIALATILAVIPAIVASLYHSPFFVLKALFEPSIIVLEALSWGLFWSAMLETSLTAALLAMSSVSLVVLLAAQLGNVWLIYSAPGEWVTIGHVELRLALALGALAASCYLIVQRARGVRVALPERELPPARRERSRRNAGLRGWETYRRWRRSGRGPVKFPVVRSLAWETWREARVVLLILLVASVLLLPLLMLSYGGVVVFLGFPMVLLWAGVSVFGLENRTRTYRFYLHHGVRPGVVWSVKVGIWIALILSIWMVAFVAVALITRSQGPFQPMALLIALFLVMYVFAVGEFCGLVIRRAVTAGAISILVLPLLVWPHQWLVQTSLIPPWTFALPPLILLAISWAWSGDWMSDRGGVGRWVRLALLVFVPFSSLVPLYIGYRAWSVPDIGPPFDLRAIQAPGLPEQNAAVVYSSAWKLTAFRNANKEFWDNVRKVIADGWDPEAQQVVQSWRLNQAAIAETQRASLKPHLLFLRDSATTTAPSLITEGQVNLLKELVALDFRERQFRVDLAGAWEDLTVLFRIAEQESVRADLFQRRFATEIHDRACFLARAWAADARQSPERLEAALQELRQLPMLRSLRDAIEAQYHQDEETINLPDDKLEALDLQSFAKNKDLGSALRAKFCFELGIAPSWERQRARRVARLLTADQLQDIEKEPWHRRNQDPTSPRFFRFSRFYGDLIDLHWPPDRPVWHRPLDQLCDDWDSTPFKDFLWLLNNPRQRDHAWLPVVDRRALEQILALRAWQLRHDGKYPRSLAELLPSELPELPLDPFSGEPFQFGQSGGEKLPKRLVGYVAMGGVLPREEFEEPPARPGQWVLWSVGPDRKDDGAAFRCMSHRLREGDLIFNLPDLEPTPAAAKEPQNRP